ncbi:Metalloendopeptidase [Aphelenchoides besseyi]|nr:Metalloendopeptidase [Aphelenchoides besseyi]
MIAKEGVTTKRWINNTVVYEINKWYSPEQKQIIRSAVTELANKTCFKFYERSQRPNAVDYIHIDKGGQCRSYIGRVGEFQYVYSDCLLLGGNQTMLLDDDCLHAHIIQHEFIHNNLGIGHEHQRPDRDSYIKILLENVEPGAEGELKRDSWYYYDSANLPYDHTSIMHYGAWGFSKNKKENH